MATTQPYFINGAAGREFQGGAGLPLISQSLDSVRTYQFEVHFKPPGGLGLNEQDLILAAKQVQAVGMSLEDIEVHRVNDKVFYPGKVSQEEMVVTFDNIYNKKTATELWSWFKSIYNPMNGQYNESGARSWKSDSATILQLDAQGQPLMETKVYGVYPKVWKTAEFNYGTNEFHTIEVTFRYDFMESVNS